MQFLRSLASPSTARYGAVRCLSCLLPFPRVVVLSCRTSRSQGARGGNQLHTNAVLEFEERLEAIKTGLAQGVDCVVWEDKTRQVEATMSVVEGDAGSSKLVFAAKGSYLIWRAPVRPMQMNSSLKVGLGHGDLQGLANQDDSTFLNMRCGGTSTEEARIVIVQVGVGWGVMVGWFSFLCVLYPSELD